MLEKVLLVDVDSIYPNLPLMKVSTYYKNKGVKVGFNVRNDVQFYVYVHDDSQHDNGAERCMMLKEMGTNAFLMFNPDSRRTQRIKNLQRWCNRKQLYWSHDYEDYVNGGSYNNDSFYSEL